MNKIHQKSCEYLTPNKTIEVLIVKSGFNEKTVFVYNYKGISFRLFSTLEQLNAFFQNTDMEEYNFESDLELDNYLLNCDVR